LVLTLDLQVQGQRHQDLKNGLAVPPHLTFGTFLDVLSKPAWAFNVLRGKRKSFGNLEGRIPDAGSLTTLSQWIAGQFDPTLSWKDVEWVKRLWGGKLVLKGILDAEDAKVAGQSGVDAIVVSNHGARHAHRPRLCLRAGRHGRSGRHARARDHPGRARRHHGPVRPAQRARGEPVDPAPL